MSGPGGDGARPGRERGQAATEYVGLLLIIAAIIAAVASTGIVPRIKDATETAICGLLSGDDAGCGGSGGSGGAGPRSRPAATQRPDLAEARLTLTGQASAAAAYGGPVAASQAVNVCDPLGLNDVTGGIGLCQAFQGGGKEDIAAAGGGVADLAYELIGRPKLVPCSPTDEVIPGAPLCVFGKRLSLFDDNPVEQVAAVTPLKGCKIPLVNKLCGKAGEAAGSILSRLPRLFGRGATKARPIGFAPGLGRSALENESRLQHATRHLIDDGVLPAWKGKSSPELFRQKLAPVLENPAGSFDDTLGGVATKVFTGRIDGSDVAIHVFKSGPYQGQIGTAVVPRGAQRARWGF